MVQLYADGYSRYDLRFTIEQVQARHPGMESEFGERWWAAMIAAEGLVGIGGGWRLDPPPGQPGFADPDFSFHEWQVWADKQKAWAAVDLIGSNARHAAAQAWMRLNGPKFGLHTFWNVNGEPWHVQGDGVPNGVRTWIAVGRPNLDPHFPLPGIPIQPLPPRPPVVVGPPIEVGAMFLANPPRRLIDTRTERPGPVGLLACPTKLDPAVVKAVRVNVTVIPQGKAGYCSNDGLTSYCQFGEGAPADHSKAFQLNADGTISLGASTPVHWVVDLEEEYH